MIFLYLFLGALADTEPGKGAEVVRRIWLAGLIPFLVGIALLFNGIFLSNHAAKLPAPLAPLPLPEPTTNQLNAAPSNPASITEHTTAHLPEQREAAYALRREEER